MSKNNRKKKNFKQKSVIKNTDQNVNIELFRSRIQKLNEEVKKQNNRCNSALIILLIFSILFTGILIKFQLSNKKIFNLSPLFFLLVIAFLNLLFLNAITKQYKKSREKNKKEFEEINKDMSKNIKKNKSIKKLLNEVENRNIDIFNIVTFIKENVDKKSIVSLIITIAFFIIQLLPYIFPNSILMKFISYTITLIISVYITSKIFQKGKISIQLLINSIFFISLFILVLNLVLNFTCLQIDFNNILNTIDICNKLYCALALAFTYLDSGK